MTVDWPYPFWIAHRGAGRAAPENTLAAFREGAARGFRMAECDVKLSSDEVPFLLHDDTLDRTTSGRGVAGTLPWSTLSRLDAGAWRDARWAGEPPATLEAVARFVQANGLAVNLEIKPTTGLEARTGEVVARTGAALWAGHAPAPLLSSFQPAALAAARQAVPALPRALLLESLAADWAARADALDVAAIVFEASLVDAALVAQVHATGRRVLVYTVNDRGRAEALRVAGVDGLITDEVHAFAADAQRPV